MNKQEFLTELNSVIIKGMVKDVNVMLGASKTAFLSTSLLLKLQPTFVAVESEYAKLPKASTIEDLDEIFRAYIPLDDPSLLIFELVYDSKKTLKRALKLAEKHADYFAFHYIKHLHATLAQVNTAEYVQAMMKQVADKEHPFLLASAVVDRNMSSLAIKTLVAAGVDTRPFEDTVEGMQTESIQDELELLSKAMDSKIITKIPGYIRKLRIKPIDHINDLLEVVADHKQGFGEYGYQRGKLSTSVIVDLSQAISHSLASSCKGTAVGDLMAASFEANHIDALWFDDLTKSVSSSVIEKSHEGYASWGNLSKTKRHLYHSPIRISTDHKLQLYVTIDQSGSVSTGDLQKILSVFEQYAHLISSAVVMHHTASVIQQYELDDSYGDLTEHPEFSAAFACRHGNGGTSHADCVKRIAKHINKNHVDPERALWLSFSDGYSDLEDVCVAEHAIMDKLEKYFIRDSRGRDIQLQTIPGKNHNIVTP
jgi:hypothetical protein